MNKRLLATGLLWIASMTLAAEALLAIDQQADASRANVTGPYFVSDNDPKPENSRWLPVKQLSDEFNGTFINSKKWQTDPKGNGWAWIGRPPAIFSSESVRIAKGMMNITVSKLPEPTATKRSEFLYQGAIVRSIKPGKPGWYFETRMKANKTVMSSTFWLMTNNKSKRKLELDIQECVGKTTELTASWAKTWDGIFHSNMIRRETRENPEKEQLQGSVKTTVKNHERFFVYAAWWKSPDEVQFFLDGEYVYSIKPNVKWNVPAYLQMAIETYDWNPVPTGGDTIATGTEEERTTQYDWIRVWKLK